MSRIGRTPVLLPEGVSADLAGHRIAVKGPKGELSRTLHPAMEVAVENGAVVVRRPSESREHRALHGLTRSLIANMVTGVTEGFSKELELYGVGFRVQQQGQRLTMQLGYSHPVIHDLPEGLAAQVVTSVPTAENNYLCARITLTGTDKELLGQTAATIRAARKPEPYKGKGFRYRGEYVRRKAGKAAQTAA